MTMVLAMVPAVSAAKTPAEGTAASNPIVMYVGDYSSDYGDTVVDCAESKHTRKVTYTEIFNGVESALSSAKYVSYDATNHAFKATAATIKTVGNKQTEGVVKVEVECSTSGCTYTKQTRYYKVYAVAKGITLQNASGTTLSSLNLSKGTQKIYYTLNPTTMNPENIEVTFRNSAVKVAEDGWDEDSNGKYFTVNVTKDGVATKVDIVLDGNTNHDSVTKTYEVLTGSAAVLTLKQGSTELANSNDDGDSYINADIGDTIAITATADSTLGSVSDIEWASSKPTVASFVSSASNGKISLKVSNAGTTTISATLGGKTAKFEVRVLKSITDIEIQDKNGDAMEDQELAIYETLVAKLKVWPTKYSDAAQYAVWSISNTNVLDFHESVEDAIDPDTGDATGAAMTFRAKKAGSAKVTVKLGDETESFRVTVNKTATSIEITDIPIRSMKATVRTGTKSEIVDRMNSNSLYTSVTGKYTEGGVSYAIQVPVEWYDAEISSDKKSATVRGNAKTWDGENNFTYSCSTAVTASVTLSDDAAVTNITITANKDVAVENDVVRLTASATVEPSSADVEYQWYANGKAVSGGTKSTLSYTIPKASVDSSTTYKFTCEVTATYKGESTTVESSAYTVTVSRDYTVSVTSTSGKTSFNVGDEISMKATLYYKGSAVSNSSFSWQLLDTEEDSLNAGVATITGSGNTAKITAKGAKSEKGTKITVRATVDYKGYSYSSSETITLNPAEAATVKQSVGSGAALKASSVTAAITKAAGVDASYIVFDSPRSCTLTKSSSSSTSIGSTKCYVSSSSSNQLLSGVYVKTSGTSASVGYTAYNSDDYVIATGTISFDSDDTGETLYASGASFKGLGAVEQITEEFPSASYVKFELPNASEGTLYFDYDTIASYQREVKESEKYYIDAGSSQDDVEDVYFLPVYGVKGTVEIDYTAYSSSNSDLGDGTITLTIKEKTASSKFTDVTYNNTGYWAAGSIDFMSDNGLFNGTSTYKFSPNDSMTRAMLVTVLYRAAGEPSVSGVTNPFTDVASKDYYYNAVLWAYKNSVVTGTSANKFSPDANVTREQIATILYRYMGSPTATGSLVGYTDRTKISSYAATAMQWAIGKGYITGTTATTLDPTGNATRAQVAVMMHRFLTK